MKYSVDGFIGDTYMKRLRYWLLLQAGETKFVYFDLVLKH